MMRPIDFTANAMQLQANVIRGGRPWTHNERLKPPAPQPVARPRTPVAITPTPPRAVRMLPLDPPDRMIREAAWENAMLCDEAQMRAPDDATALASLTAIALAAGIAPPEAKPNSTIRSLIARLCAAKWWRRRLRTAIARRVERVRIVAGKVHRHCQCYVSDSGVYRRQMSGKRNGELMKLMVAVNEHGECFTLADLAETNTSNPVLRRNELMTRIKGLETLARKKKWKCLFATWTLPSRFHPVHSGSGEPNEKHDGSTPRQGADQLQDLWQKVRAVFNRRRIKFAGMRVAEPHHDATPHWHLLIFCSPKHRAFVMTVLKRYALRESPDEDGAQQRRIIFEGILPEKGSAVGYVAKYIAKNVDGFQLKETIEHGADGQKRSTGDAVSTAERIRAWASHWVIRQFQFFGCPPVTWWREFRRLLKPIKPEQLEAARAAADEGDYAEFVKECGGLAARRKDCSLATYREQARNKDGSEAVNVYGELRGSVVKGIALAIDAAIRVITRIHEWKILPPSRAADAFPWTRVNNCNNDFMPTGLRSALATIL